MKKRDNRVIIPLRGEGEIRTLGTLFTYSRFPGDPIKPLLHLSKIHLPCEAQADKEFTEARKRTSGSLSQIRLFFDIHEPVLNIFDDSRHRRPRGE